MERGQGRRLPLCGVGDHGDGGGGDGGPSDEGLPGRVSHAFRVHSAAPGADAGADADGGARFPGGRCGTADDAGVPERTATTLT